MPFPSQNQLEIKRKPLQRIAHFLKRETAIVKTVQWSVIFIYIFLLISPLVSSFLDAEAFNSIWEFTQLILWRTGWPLIILSSIVFGRVWCGFFCPDGTLTETISQYGQKRLIPRWIRWKSWPLFALIFTIICGQIVSVYDNHIGTLLLLGIPTLGAGICGYLYADGRRVWCMYLCPVNAIFSTFAKISVLYFNIQTKNWKKLSAPPPRLNCPTLIDIKRMDSMSACHSCCRCVGYIGAVELDLRPPKKEILFSKNNERTQEQDANILLFGILGVCNFALQWKKHESFILLKNALKELIGSLGNYNLPTCLSASDAKQIYTILDAVAITTYIILGSAIIYFIFRFFLWAAIKTARNTKLTWQKLSLAFIPFAASSVSLGLLERNVLYPQTPNIPSEWFILAQTSILFISCLYSLSIAIRLLTAKNKFRQIISTFVLTIPCCLVVYCWQ